MIFAVDSCMLEIFWGFGRCEKRSKVTKKYQEYRLNSSNLKSENIFLTLFCYLFEVVPLPQGVGNKRVIIFFEGKPRLKNLGYLYYRWVARLIIQTIHNGQHEITPHKSGIASMIIREI